MIKSIHQHNIGTIPVNFDTVIYDNTGYLEDSNIISHKTRRPFHPRNIFDYSEHYPNQDIYLLQEVQDGPVDNDKYITLNDKPYFYSYTKTGHLFYTDEDEIAYDSPINHGCVVAFNAEKYKLIGMMDIYNTRKRCSKFIIFSDDHKIYAALSVHGEIISDFTERFYSRLTNFYNGLIGAITNIKEYYNGGVDFIISGDFNLNLFKPNFNPFNTIPISIFLRDVDDYIYVINDFLDFLIENGIYVLEIPDYTNYNIDSKFLERIDFIFLSESIHKEMRENRSTIKLGEFYKYEKPDLEEIEELYFENDFDHSYISIRY